MNILIIAPKQIPVPPKAGGSVEYCIYQIAKQFPDGHQITIASRKPFKSRTKQQEENPSDSLPRFIRVPRSDNIPYISAVLRRVKQQSFDLIQVDNRPVYIPRVKEAFPDTPVAIFLHSLTYATPVKDQIARSLSAADLVIANSQSLREKLIQYYPNLRHKIHVVHPGVDLQQFRPPSQQQRARLYARNRLSSDSFTMVYAGRIIPRKGLPVLLLAIHYALKSIPSIQLVIAGKPGKPSYLAYLKNLAASLQVPVLFLGQVPHEHMHQVYWLADCFVCPSQQHEAFGLVVAEAAASGAPVIASRNGGIAEIIEHRKEGLLIDAYNDPKSFAQQIIRLAYEPYLRKQLAKQGRLKMEQCFSWSRTASRLKDIYAEYVIQGEVSGNASRKQMEKDDYYSKQ